MLSELVSKGIVSGIKVTDKSDFFCEACQLGKSHKLPFNKSVEKVCRQPGEYIHSDVCGPMSIGGAKFIVIFKDNASGFRQVFFLNINWMCLRVLKYSSVHQRINSGKL